MRYIYIIFILFGILFSFTNCKETTPSKQKSTDNYLSEDIITTPLGEYQVYHNGHQGYSIQVPKGWIYKVKKNTVLVIQSTKQSSTDYVESLDVVIVDAGFQQKKDGSTKRNSMDLNAFYQKHVNNLSKSDFDLSVMAEGEKLINGKMAKWTSLKPNDTRKDLKIIKHFIANEHQVFILTANIKDETFSTLGPIFNEVAESFRILPDNS